VKVIPSFLIGSMSGKAGNAVAAVWKGIQYIRQHVIPTNPNTVDQQAQRARFSLIVSWWHALSEAVVAYLDILAEGQGQSGFNLFQSRNVKDLYAVVDPRLIPLSTKVEPISTWVVATESVGGLQATWDAADAVPTSTLEIYCCKFDGTDYSGEIFQPDYTPPLVSAETVTFGNLEPGEQYQCFAIVKSATAEYSVAVADDETVQTE